MRTFAVRFIWPIWLFILAVFSKGYEHVKFELKDVRADCFCASLLRTATRANSHATSCIERTRQVLKWTMIGQMAIAIALLGFNDLGRSVTPTFLFRNRLYLQYLHIVQKWTKNQCGKLKQFQDFCLRDMESCHLAAARRVTLWSL